MKKVQMVDLQGQYSRIKDEIDAAIRNVINSAAFINGPQVAVFQENLGKWLGVNHAVTCGNGTDALQVALMALGTEPGDEVITTPFTFIATAEAISLLGLKPVFVDVCPRSFNINVSEIAKAITGRTRVILPVHLYGQCSDMEAINEIASRHGLSVIEDAAQSLGSECIFSDGTRRKAGTIGDIGCTSFFPSKNLGCFGDGGAMMTNNPELAEKLRSITFHGSKVKYYHDDIGVNSRLDTLQAAVLDVKLKYLDQYNRARREAASYYDNALGHIRQLQLPATMNHSTHIFHAYTLKTGPRYRDPLRDHLAGSGIPTMIYYPVPVHLQKAYARYGYREGDFPVAEELSASVLSIPMHTEFEEEQLEYICNAIDEFFKNH